MKWEPIETAPKDGTAVLVGVWELGPDVASAAWNGDFWDMRYLYDDDLPHSVADKHNREFVAPTHWMPLPDPPE